MTRRRLVAFGTLTALSLACTLPADDDAPPTPTVPTPTVPMPTVPTPAVPTPAVRTPAPAPTFDPHASGTRVLARFQGGAAAYAAVVTETGTAGRVNVVYADGDTETVEAATLVPDSLGAGSRVEARIRQWPRFFPGVLERRLGHAVFVRFDDGDQQWTSIGLVRAAAGPLARDGAEVPAPPATIAIPEVGAPVVANYQRRGWYYAGVIVGARDNGHVDVVYADGDREWLARDEVRPDAIVPGTRVSAQRPRTTAIVEGVVRRRVGHAVELQLDDGSKLWIALPNVRVR